MFSMILGHAIGLKTMRRRHEVIARGVSIMREHEEHVLLGGFSSIDVCSGEGDAIKKRTKEDAATASHGYPSCSELCDIGRSLCVVCVHMSPPPSDR